MAERPSPEPRAAYRHRLAIPTRWMDFDVYGHVNNVQYYAYFDTVVNKYLIDAGVLEPATSPVVGLVVETRCAYFRELTFPDVVEAMLRVGRLGRSSVRYDIGLFRDGDDGPAAQGHFVHVYVDRTSRRPVELPDALRAALLPLAVG